jgi:deoxyribodipyrimidine photolyase-related protein
MTVLSADTLRIPRPTAQFPDQKVPKNCSFWNFLIKREEKLRANPRFGPAVLGLRNIDEDERIRIEQQAAAFLHQLNTDSKTEQ